MPQGKPINRSELHQHFFKKSDRFGKLEIFQKKLAEELGITQATMSLIIKEMVEDGRIKKVASKRQNVGVYTIRDPGAFEHKFQPYTVPGLGLQRCRLCGALDKTGAHYESRHTQPTT